MSNSEADNMRSLYELLASGIDKSRLLAWTRGDNVAGLPRLSPAEARILDASWEFTARPGQRWTPGREFITDFEAGRGFGKALSLATPLPTPTGWITMGDASVGTTLMDEQGKPCTVTAVFEVDAAEAWRLHFSDSSHVDACGDHQWVTMNCLERKRLNRQGLQISSLWAHTPTRTTREVVATLTHGPRGDTNHCVPVSGPLILPDADLLVSPYMLGLWLGDGNTDGGYVTSHVDDAAHYEARAIADGEVWRRMKVDPARPHIGLYSIGPRMRLSAIGVLNDKHIPAIYLRASFRQRLALLQGLIDTDGHVNKNNGHIEYVSMSQKLASNVAELARTLGQKPRVTTGRAMLRGTDHGTKYRVTWRPTIQVASLPRKVSAIHPRGAQGLRNTHRMITGATPLPPQRMRCVTVDSPAHMYLCGESMIPTHNSRVGSESIAHAANDPERWGGAAYIGGVDPLQVMNYCLTAPQSGLFAVAKRNEQSGLGPGVRKLNLNNRVMTFEAPRGGGGAGLTVYWGASSDPKSVRGPNYGLAWLDEYGIWYHRKTDEQGTNLWGGLIPAMRAGASPKIIITQTPSRAPEVKVLQSNAERPECKACRADYVEHNGRYLGEPGAEPWRLPPSPQIRLHPLLDTRTTVVVRECPACGSEVIATTRAVFGATTDNPMIAGEARDRAVAILASGTAASRQEYAPQGEADSGARGTLVQDKHIARLDIEVAEAVPDRWAAVLGTLGAEEVVVHVDPAVTAKEDSDDSGVVVACLRRVPEDRVTPERGRPVLLRDQVVGLQDWSVRADEVEAGAPSSVWGPRAYWLALLWGAARITVEVNNGGDELLSLVQGLIARPPSPADIAARLREERPTLPPAAAATIARRMHGAALRLVVESVSRAADKPARWGWYGETAARGEQAVACLPWTGGARGWSVIAGQLCNFEPGRSGARRSGTVKKDRADSLIACAQVLLRVRESAGRDLHDPRADAWMGRTPAPR